MQKGIQKAIYVTLLMMIIVFCGFYVYYFYNEALLTYWKQKIFGQKIESVSQLLNLEDKEDIVNNLSGGEVVRIDISKKFSILESLNNEDIKKSTNTKKSTASDEGIDLSERQRILDQI